MRPFQTTTAPIGISLAASAALASFSASFIKKSSGDTVGLSWNLIQPRANENLFACRIAHNDVLAGEVFCENPGACFGGLKVFRPLNPIGAPVQ